MPAPDRWVLEDDGHGHSHVVEIDDAGLGRRLVWRRNGEEVSRKRTGDVRVQLLPAQDAPTGIGVVGLRFVSFGPARRVAWYAPDAHLRDDADLVDGDLADGVEGFPASAASAGAAALLGIGGIDFTPEPGSRAARRQDWIHTHPRLHTARATGLAAAAVVGGLVITWLLARVVLAIDLPDIPWPDLPRIPRPDLPDIPWPELPSIPWPDVQLPAWVREVAEKGKLVLPVVVAFAVARGEIRRHRQQVTRRTGTARDDDRCNEEAGS